MQAEEQADGRVLLEGGGPVHQGDARHHDDGGHRRTEVGAAAGDDRGWQSDGELVRSAVTLHPEDDDFGQAGTLVREVLSDPQREAIELAYFGGCTYQQVGEQLGQPEGTVKGRIRSGLKKMKLSLVDAEIEPG